MKRMTIISDNITMRNTSKLFIMLTLLVGLNFRASGQQMSLHSQFLMNEYLVNPAVAGHDGFSKVNLTAREQWLGFPQSPKTHSASFQTRLLNSSYIVKKNPIRKKNLKPSKMGRVGLGALVFDDRNGLISRTGFQITYAYHIPFRESQLSLGISAEGYQFKLNHEDVVLADPDDPDYLIYDPAVFIPDANFGVYYLAKDYSLGFSVYHMFQSSLKMGKTGENDYQMLRHYFMTGGYTLDLRNDFLLQGYLLLRTTNTFRSFQSDISVTAFYKNSYWFGLSYRTANTIIIKAGLKIEQLNFGYAFDYNINSIRKYTYGSHEFTAAVKFGGNARRYRWLNHNLY